MELEQLINLSIASADRLETLIDCVPYFQVTCTTALFFVSRMVGCSNAVTQILRGNMNPPSRRLPP
jgi:hypothetical protein